jgi:DNA-binding response OmpR family regulator
MLHVKASNNAPSAPGYWVCRECGGELTWQQEPLPPEFFDRSTHTVVSGGFRIARLEWRLLEILWRHQGSGVALETLMAVLYLDKADPPYGEIIRVWVYRLRRKLADTPYAIQTVPGGYMLVER